MASHLPHRANATAVGISGHRDVGDIYRSLGVEPLINCAGVRTNYGASNPAPEVIAAMNAAAQAFVDLDELSDGIGKRLSELTGAEWGVVTAGTAASLALATAACIAGNNPELMLRLPDTSAMRNKVIVPADHRFAYEQAIRIAGAEIVSVASPEELRTALDDHVAMVCLLGRNSRSATLPLEMIIAASKAKGVPVLINAAGLSPGRPDSWITRGADLVVYADGKYIRGPQSTAIVLGSKPLCQAMWWNSAPHQAFARSNGRRSGADDAENVWSRGSGPDCFAGLRPAASIDSAATCQCWGEHRGFAADDLASRFPARHSPSACSTEINGPAEIGDPTPCTDAAHTQGVFGRSGEDRRQRLCRGSGVSSRWHLTVHRMRYSIASLRRDSQHADYPTY